MGTDEVESIRPNWPTLADIENCLCGFSSTSLHLNSANSTALLSYQTTPFLGGNSSVSAAIDDVAAVNCFSWRTKDSSASLVAPTTVCSSSSSLLALPIGAGVTSTTPVAAELPPPRSYANFVEDVLYQRVAVAICCFGLIGNAVNIAVLAAAGRRQNLGGTSSTRMQRFARIGLIALAIADSSFCLSVIPHAFVERDPFRPRIDFSLFYAAYGDAFINWFAMSGTWLTVAMAVGRYAAVCHPFRARAAIGRTVALRSIASVFFACLIANVPRFMSHTIESVSCRQPISAGNRTVEYYFRWPGPLHARRNARLELAYVWAYFLVAVAAPLVVLLYTGCRLGFRLRRSRRDAVERDAIGGGGGGAAAASEVIDRPFTVTLVAVAAMHVILVSPAELLNFARQRLLLVDGGDGGATAAIPEGSDEAYNLLATVLNTLQAANYSMNFLLYCAVNVAFRRRFVEMVGCRMTNGSGLSGGPATYENRHRLQMLLNTGALVDLSTFSSSRSRHRMLRRSASDRGYSSGGGSGCGWAAERTTGYTSDVAAGDGDGSYDGCSLSRKETVRLQISSE